MFLRSFLQRKSKKDSEGSHSTSKGDKNAGKKNDPKLEVVKMTKMKSLPDNQEDSEVSGLKNHEGWYLFLIDSAIIIKNKTSLWFA